jgi:hypothetical protein
MLFQLSGTVWRIEAPKLLPDAVNAIWTRGARTQLPELNIFAVSLVKFI